MAIPIEKRIRVLLAKSDMDGHDRGIRYVAQMLREAGMEVIFIRYRLIEEVAQAALQEGVNVIGLSFYAYGAVEDTSIVMKVLKDQHMEDVSVILGGIFSDEEDLSKLQEMGVRGIFGPGDSTGEVIDCITKSVIK